MALTPILKPSGFQPLGTGELIYTFQEASIAGKPNYKVNITITGITGPTLSYSPNSTLLVTVDVAVFFRYALSMSPTVANRFKSGYVTYQAIWTGGSDAPVGLSGDVIYGYIGSNTHLNRRTKFYIDSTGGNFLADQIHAVIGRTSYIDFLHDASLAATCMLRFNGVRGIGSSFTTFAGNAVNMESISLTPTVEYEDIDLKSYAGTATWGTSVAGGTSLSISPVLQAYAQKFTTPASAGKISIKIPMWKSGKPDYTIVFKIVGNSAGLPNEADVKDTVTINKSTWEVVSEDFNSPTYLTLDFDTFTLAGSTVYHFLILYQNDSTVDPFSNYINIFRPGGNPYAGGEYETKFAGVWTGSGIGGHDITATTYYFGDTYATIPFNFIDECANPLYLKWLNDYGGLSTYLFDYNQIFTNDPTQGDGRYKKMIIFLQSVTDDQWRAIQELNRSGAEYGDNQKLGAYVVDFTDESNVINIFVEPQLSSTPTKARGNNAQLVLRYPLIDNILI